MRGLVHRDVKPSNLLVDPGARPDGSDHVYLADFGLTRRVSEETGIGDDGHLLGTIDYVAPEQIPNYAGSRGRRAVFPGRALTFCVVAAAFVIFRSPNLAVAGSILEAMVGMDGLGPADAAELLPIGFLGLVAALLVFVNVAPNTWEVHTGFLIGASATGLRRAPSRARRHDDRGSYPFIYFQF